jgi:hypothetical protein
VAVERRGAGLMTAEKTTNVATSATSQSESVVVATVNGSTVTGTPGGMPDTVETPNHVVVLTQAVAELQGEVRALREENAVLRGAVRQAAELSAQLSQDHARMVWLESTIASRTGVDNGQVIQRQTTIVNDDDTDWKMDQTFIDADIAWNNSRYGRDAELVARLYAERQDAKRAAQAKCAARQGQNQPVRNDQYDWQSQVPPARMPDMTFVPAAPGGVMVKRPGGQITTKTPSQATCELGHAVGPEDKWCSACGSKLLGSPEIGGLWDETQALAAQRRREEGVEE